MKKGGKQIKKANGYHGSQLNDHGEKGARALIGAGAKVHGMSIEELRAKRKGDWRKAQLAAMIQDETTMRLDWISEELRIGTRAGVCRTAKVAREGAGSKRKLAATREAKGAAREKAAKKSGVSANAADKAVKVIEEADRLKDEGKVEESTELINALNKSINTAHKMVKQKDAPADAPPSKPKAPEPVVTLPVVTGGPQEIFSQDDAIASAKAIVRFLRRHDASDFTPDQSVEWYQIANEISGRLRELKIL